MFENAEALEKWLLGDDIRQHDAPHYGFPDHHVQTNVMEKLRGNYKKAMYKPCEIFDTICSATEKRQSEAARLAQRCESMIVIGDRNSSNTKRLREICSEVCKHTCLIDSGADIIGG